MHGLAQRRITADKTRAGAVWVDEDGIDSPNHAAPPSAPMGLPGRPLCPTMTIRDAIQSAEARFKEAGIDSARLDAELLLGHLLDVPHLQVWLRQAEPLTPSQAGKWERLIARRESREPLQHITGWTAFLDLELHVNRDVLIPRPETEVLAQLAIERLAALASPARALDWGTGSGCLALSLAKAVPAARITAVDASADALRIARANAIAQGLADRIRFVEGSGFGALGESPTEFDLIVSNPPYIPTAEIQELDPEVRDHDPRLALDGGPDGLDCYRELARTALPWLRPGGPLLLECGDGQAGPVADLFRGAGWLQESIEKDLSGRDRVLIVARPRG